MQGYYIEVHRSQADQVPPDWIRRQTIRNAERYVTAELKSFEDRVLGARDRALARERTLYEALLDALIAVLPALQASAAALATLDVLANLAERAIALRLVKPRSSRSRASRFAAGGIPSSSTISMRRSCPTTSTCNEDRRALVVTGPNMGGKSTYMRQNALIVILAGIGSFVPAESAVIGPVDRIFSRIGAADDLAGGRSTFMVEMTEAANILNNATARSLVLMDEIGRGTSTYDGLSLAWACARQLIRELKCYTLFATHYFELTSLADELAGCANVHLDATEHGEDLVFLHAVREGPANRSFGLQVARLAGVPVDVLSEARRYLAGLERRDHAAERRTRPAVAAARHGSRPGRSRRARRVAAASIPTRCRRATRRRRSTACVSSSDRDRLVASRCPQPRLTGDPEAQRVVGQGAVATARLEASA